MGRRLVLAMTAAYGSCGDGIGTRPRTWYSCHARYSISATAAHQQGFCRGIPPSNGIVTNVIYPASESEPTMERRKVLRRRLPYSAFLRLIRVIRQEVAWAQRCCALFIALLSLGD